MLFGCEKKQEEAQVEPQKTNSDGQMTKLGNRLENPFTVQNMSKALSNITKTARLTEDVQVETSHLYLKFKPKNEAELDILKKDSTIIYYDYPLDYTIEVAGDYYHDPSLPANVPTYQYASIPVGQKIPEGVDYDVIDECYIPDDLPKTNTSTARTVSEDVANTLIQEAFKITGNKLDNTKSNANARTSASKWTPNGRIQVWDNVANRYVGVHDALVTSRNWLTTREGLTQWDGSFICNGSLRGSGQYRIKWEKYEFSVRSGTLGQAEANGPEVRGYWNYNIGGAWNTVVNDSQIYYALIFQAARDYYYGFRFGLSSPPRNTFWHPQIKIAADISRRQNNKPSHAANYARLGGAFPTIYIRTWEERADVVYAVTTHELAHAAHWDMDRIAFGILAGGVVLGRNSAEAVIESWANGVEWQFANARYRNYLGLTCYEYGWNTAGVIVGIADRGYQNRTIESDPHYTAVVVDLIDIQNQFINFGNGFPNDNVSGYNIKQIEDGLRGKYTWDDWANGIRDKHDNPTEGNLEQLFNNWY